MRQLAIVGEDGQIRAHDLEDSSQVVLTPGRGPGAPEGTNTICNWPTWSPDGARLAYFRHTVAGGEVRENAVCVVSADGTETETWIPSASASPIYMAWSPDGQRLAALVQEGSSLQLRVVDSRRPDSATTIAQGVPLYFAWHPDSMGVIANVGSGRGLALTSRLVWIRLEGGQAIRTAIGRLPSAGFRAPVWAAGRHAATVALEQSAGSEIALLDGPEAAGSVLTTAGRSPALAWSPDEQHLAFASRGEDDALYTGISIYASADGGTRQLVDTPALAFFWCGNGRLVYVTGDLAQRTVAVRLIEIGTGTATDIGWARPSRDLLMLFSHFDQYLQSVALVSPDGNEFTLAASRAKELENGSIPTVRQILVRSLADPGSEREIGRGRLAFWRPAVSD